MSPSAILEQLRAKRIELVFSPEDRRRLRVRSRPGALTPDLRELLRLHREELLAALAPSTPPAPPPAPSSPEAPTLGAQLLAHLEGADVRIALFDDGSLGWDAPPDYMTPQLRAAIAEAAPEILAELLRCGRKAIPRWLCLAELDPARYARPSPPPPSAPPSTPAGELQPSPPAAGPTP